MSVLSALGVSARYPAEVRAIYADLGRQILEGVLSAPVEKVYPVKEIQTAQAQRGERSGKILMAPNGPV